MILNRTIILSLLLAISKLVYTQNISKVDIAKFNVKDTQLLNKIVGDCKVIGLGESAHGAGTIFDLKTDIIKELVLKHNFKNIVFESSFWGTQSMNKYIHNEDLNIKDVFLDMGQGVYINNEVNNLLKWLKEYNLNQPDSLKVSFYGCDVYGITLIANYFKIHPWVTNNLSSSSIETLDSLSKFTKWKKTKIGIERTKLLYEDFRKNYKPNTFRTIEENYILTLLSDHLKYTKINYGYRRELIRDEIMANTIIYLAEQKPKEKFIIWSHNGHISKARNSTFIYPMGAHLNQYFGANYKSIAISFYTGTLRSYNHIKNIWDYCKTDTAIKTSIEAIASDFNGDLAYINFENTKESNKFLGKTSIRSIGAVYFYDKARQYYSKQKLYKGFNGLVVIRKVYPPHVLNNKE
jgi:erythromycin esterase